MMDSDVASIRSEPSDITLLRRRLAIGQLRGETFSEACRALHSGPAEACSAAGAPGCGNPSLVNLAELIALGDDDVRLVPLSSWDWDYPAAVAAQPPPAGAERARHPLVSSPSSSDDSIGGCHFTCSDLIAVSSWDEEPRSVDGRERFSRSTGGPADSMVNLAQHVMRVPRGPCQPATRSAGVPLFGRSASRR